jgi:hypothetical protein
MNIRHDTHVFGLVALILSCTGLVCIVFARPYRDFMLRFQGVQRLQPDWLTKFQRSESTIWAIRTSGIVAILMAALLGYIGYMSSR